MLSKWSCVWYYKVRSQFSLQKYRKKYTKKKDLEDIMLSKREQRQITYDVHLYVELKKKKAHNTENRLIVARDKGLEEGPNG